MAHVIIKIIDTQAEKEVKFEGDDADTIKEADRVTVSVAAGFGSKAVVTVVCG
jgi:hypothetical protein